MHWCSRYGAGESTAGHDHGAARGEFGQFRDLILVQAHGACYRVNAWPVGQPQDDEVFGETLAREGKVPQKLVQSYLSIRERMQELEAQLG